jgi:hypothetical protein
MSDVIGCGSSVEGCAPDVKHDRLHDTGPKQQNAADHCHRTQSGHYAAGDEYGAHDHERRRNDPEGARVLDRSFAF